MDCSTLFWRGPDHFKLGAHFLQARSKRFNLFLLARDSRLLFLILAMLLQKLVKQHRVHLLISNAVGFSFFVAHHQITVYFLYLFGYQPKLENPLRITLLFVMEGNWFEGQDCFARFVHRSDVLLESSCGGRYPKLTSTGVHHHRYALIE